jgi:hypothetical protein
MVVGELPMLRIKHKNGDYTPIKKDTLYGIFKELANEGFLISHPENQKQGRAYYAFSPKMHLLFGKNTARNTCGYKSTPTDINPDTYGYKSLPPYGYKSRQQ